MSVCIIGTVALDSITTPEGSFNRVLGGSAAYAATAAQLFTDAGIVSIIGKDFPQEHLEYLQGLGINTDGLVKSAGDTFHWTGAYEGDMSQAITKQTDLNALLEFDPVIPESQKDADIVFCANFDPELQAKAIAQFTNPKLVVLDTMNFWIDTKLSELKNTLKKVDLLIINDQEIRQLTGISNIVQALPKILEMGPERVIVKKGENGAMMYDGEQFFMFPAFPLHHLVDPTGAGDSFAGGIIGILAAADRYDTQTFRRAIIYGTLVSSFTVQGFSLDTLKKASPERLHERYQELHNYLEIPAQLA